jgi:hypothetical protein
MRWGQALLALALLLSRPGTGASPDPKDLVLKLKASWDARDPDAYLALWDFKTPEQADQERLFARGFSVWQQTLFMIEGVGPGPTEDGRIRLSARTFSRSEPRAKEEEWLFTLARTQGGWSIVERAPLGAIDGLSHPTLDPKGYKAAGRRLQFEDFDLKMEEGTIFTSQPEIGPTVLVFVGKGTLTVSPKPPTERHVLQKFAGAPELKETIHTAFVRIHPADFHRALNAQPLEPDPGAQSRLAAARTIFDAEIAHSFVLDADLPGSPWWVFPGVGDSLVTFPTARHGTLTFTVFASEPEGISLFDRMKKRQICLYPTEGKDTHFNEDEGETIAIESHTIRARFDTDHDALDAEDTVKIKLLFPVHTIRLRLDEAFHVRSITSGDGEQHPFFRVRDQDTLMVSLGTHSLQAGEITLHFSYAGPCKSGPIDSEAQLASQSREPMETRDEEIPLEKSIVLTTRSPWYPQSGTDEYTTYSIQLDTPASHRAVSGGVLASERVEGGRRIVEYRLENPGKYLAAVVARLQEGGKVQAGPTLVSAYLTPRGKREASQLLQNTAEILQFYTKEFGPCPYPSINVVTLESENGGGHSPPAMVILAERPVFLKGVLRQDPGNFSDIPTFFLAHELAHQWWGHGVAGMNYHERWLSEGLAQYAAALWTRHRYGQEAFRGVLHRLADWALRDNAQGPISLGYRLTQVAQDPKAFRAIVYDKGAYVLLMLREIVGEEALTKALRSVQEHHRFQKIGTGDLEKAIEEASGQDLKGYFENWVYGMALPRLRVSHKTVRSGALYRTTVTVEAQDVPGPLPLEVLLTTDQGSKRTKVTLSNQPASWVVDTPSAPRKVEVNPDRALLLRVEADAAS